MAIDTIPHKSLVCKDCGAELHRRHVAGRNPLRCQSCRDARRHDGKHGRERPPCAVDGCGMPTISRGWCSVHYNRWRVHGDPIALTPAKRRKAEREAQKALKSAEWQLLLANAAIRRPRTCEYCRTTFFRTSTPTRDKGRFCSRECAFAFARAIASFARVTYTVHRARCRQCDRPFTAPRINRLYCSDDCRNEWNAAAQRERDSAQSGRDFSPRKCKACGMSFATEYGDKRKEFCSKLCAKRYAKRLVRKIIGNNNRRRARHHGVEYESIPVKRVFERDGWRCQICGRKTPKRLRGTIKPNAPELDHRIPMAMGGGHVWGNVQCACRECNQRKGGTASNGQLPLFINGLRGGV